MRSLITLVAIIAMLGLTGGAASADPTGANGTVKIHEYPEHKNGSENANDPKVCRFEIHGNNFDGAQTGRWWIQDQKWGNGDSTKAVAPIGTRTYTANSAGDWTDNGGAGFTVPEGHYKLFVEMTHRAGNSGNTVVTYKQKVFKVECGGTNTGGTNTGGTNTGGTNTGGTNTDNTNTDNTNTGNTGNTGGGGSDQTSNDTQTTGDTTVHTETTIVVEGGQQVRVVRIFNNGALVNEVRTALGSVVAGFESGPTGQVIVIVEGVQSSAPSELAQTAGVLGAQGGPTISQLPATSTAAGFAGLGAIGAAAIAAGLALLRRRPTA